MILINVLGLLELGENIPFQDICTIYPIKVLDIIRMSNVGAQQYKYAEFPYSISEDLLEDNEESVFYSIINDERSVEYLKHSLELFCHEKNTVTLVEAVQMASNGNQAYSDIIEQTLLGIEEKSLFDVLLKKNCLILENHRTINNDNFDEFADLIRKANVISLIEKEEEIKCETEEGLRSLQAIRAGRESQRKADKRHDIENLINVAQHGITYIPTNEIKEWSFWKLMNEYTSSINRDTFDKSVQLGCAGAENAIGKHWSETLMVT